MNQISAPLTKCALALCTWVSVQSTAFAEESVLETAISSTCQLNGEVPAQRFEFEAQLPGNDQMSRFQLTQIYCSRAAYNTTEMWILKDQYGEEQLVSFAVPSYKVEYEDETEQKTVVDIAITSYDSVVQLSNSTFDPTTLLISSFHKWRGVGDASSGGTWEFRDGKFVLNFYEVDASLDGEINPQTMTDFGRPTP